MCPQGLSQVRPTQSDGSTGNGSGKVLRGRFRPLTHSPSVSPTQTVHQGPRPYVDPRDGNTGLRDGVASRTIVGVLLSVKDRPGH